MLTKRIIPCLDVREGSVVKGVHFKNLKKVGFPPDLACTYDAQGADEVIFLDVSATVKGKQTLLECVKETAQRLFIPLTVGGGIRTVEDMRNVLKAGADKISINTAAVQRPKLITEGSKRFGAQCIVVAIDAKSIKPGKWVVYTHGGTRSTTIDAVKWAKQVQRCGAGEIMLTSMDKDGTVGGYDIELTRTIVRATNIPIIASGGAGNPEHMRAALQEGEADAALAASIFHYGQYTVGKVKSYLRKAGVNVR
jgi:imidazole glycerol-phosphate synthase subunit HisF